VGDRRQRITGRVVNAAPFERLAGLRGGGCGIRLIQHATGLVEPSLKPKGARHLRQQLGRVNADGCIAQAPLTGDGIAKVPQIIKYLLLQHPTILCLPREIQGLDPKCPAITQSMRANP
jgi:hypothetical protein